MHMFEKSAPTSAFTTEAMAFHITLHNFCTGLFNKTGPAPCIGLLCGMWVLAKCGCCTLEGDVNCAVFIVPV
eukprot:9904016-Ditylum_brightwellii.AAC.1